MESAWVDPIEPEPPDPTKQDDDEGNVQDATQECEVPERVGLEYCYHLRMRNHRLERHGHLVDKPVFAIEGLTEGNDWALNKDGSWFIPSMDLEAEMVDTSQESFSDTFHHDRLIFKKCATTPNEIPLSESPAIQSDTGANANVTSDVKLLQNIQWVEPVHCDSAKKGATLEI